MLSSLKKLKNKKYLAIAIMGVLILLAVAFPLISQGAPEPYESFLEECDLGTCMFQNLIAGLLWMVGTFFGHLAGFFGALTHWMIGFGTTIIGLPVVKAGFSISLNVVNLLFVMGLIISAFQIILGLGERNAKKMIALIIMAAILVNFSMLIAGFILDVSNVFTEFFISGFRGGELTTSLTGNIDSSLLPNKDALTTQGWANFFLIAQVAILRIILYLLVAITLLSTLVMALVRNIWVAFLLLLMPLSWGFWGFPGLQKYHKKWWDNFLKWGLLYLPSMTFFLWLAVTTAESMGTIAQNSGAFSTGGTGVVAVLESVAGDVIQILLLAGIMIAGLKVAQEVGGIGSGLGMSLAGKAGKLTKRMGVRLGKGGMRGAYSGVRGAYRVTGAEKGAKAASRGISKGLTYQPKNKFARFAKNLAVGGATLGNSDSLARGTAKFGSYKKRIDEAQKQFADYSSGQFKNILQNPNETPDPTTHAAILKEATKRDVLSDVTVKDKYGNIDNARTKKNIQVFKDATVTANPGKNPKKIDELKALAETFPELSEQITGQTMADVLAKMKDTKKLTTTSLKNPKIVSLLTKSQLSSAASKSGENETIIRETLMSTITLNASSLPAEDKKELQKISGSIKFWQKEEGKAKEEEGGAREKNDEGSVEKAVRRREEATKTIRELVRVGGEMVDKVNPEKMRTGSEEKDALIKLKHLDYSVGSARAQAKKPKTKKEEVNENQDTGKNAKKDWENLTKNI